MRIAVLCTDLGIKIPGDKGASLHLAAISQAFATAGHDVLLLGVAGHGAPPAGLEHLLLPHPGRSSGLRRELRKARFVANMPAAAGPALDAFRPDVVYERLSLFGTAGKRLAERAGVPHVVEINALLAREEQQWRGLRLGAFARQRERVTLDHAMLRVAVSAEIAAQVDEVAPGGRTVVVANGVDLDLFADLPDRESTRRDLGLSADTCAAVFVGALRPWHGLDVAIRALSGAPPHVRLLVAGDGPVATELRLLADGLGVSDRVAWLGHVPHDAVPGVLAAADIAVAPYPDSSTFSFSPLKLYEYLAAGTPVVASAIGQIPEVLAGGRFGTLVAPGDPRALAAAFLRFTLDPAPARRVAATARRYAFEHFGWQRRAEEIVDHIIAAGAARNREVPHAMAN
ncbi:MAG TPA: glycosyltransferase family 4 protein [Ilumatobacteraceae bacterium]|nr:glycosyltransferase family 4 protein [Ilumatobacteraceae bacterium]